MYFILLRLGTVYPTKLIMTLGWKLFIYWHSSHDFPAFVTELRRGLQEEANLFLGGPVS